MTVGEFKKRFSESRYDDLEITIHKQDSFQSTASTTVKVSAATIGFDWTDGQVVLEPIIKISTEQSVLDKNLVDRAREFSAENTRLLGIMANVANLSSLIDDEKVRATIQSELRKAGNAS